MIKHALLAIAVATSTIYAADKDVVVAYVNQTPVYLSQSEIKNGNFDAIREEAITKTLIYEDFDKQGMSIPQQVLDDRISQIISKEFGGSKPNYENHLKSIGYSPAEFMEIERKKLILNAILQKTIKSDEPSEKELEYSQYIKTLRSNAKIELLKIQA